MLRYLPESLKERLRLKAGAITQRARLLNLRRAGFHPSRIIDGGAFRGEWSLLAREIFPDAHLLLIEPQPHLKDHLSDVCARLDRARLQSALLGRESSVARFAVAASNSRVVSPEYQPSDAETVVELPVRRLADIATDTGFTGAEFLKLDLQGHELEALAGAGLLFGNAEVILIEVSLIPIGGVPLIADVMTSFSQKGYRLYDIFGANHRPLDGALWQSDLVFVRLDSPLIASSRWS
jgi:FkbM family methyltransferase